jgi:hypothetical protein
MELRSNDQLRGERAAPARCTSCRAPSTARSPTRRTLVDRYTALGYDAQVEWPAARPRRVEHHLRRRPDRPHFLRLPARPGPPHASASAPPTCDGTAAAWVTLDALLSPRHDRRLPPRAAPPAGARSTLAVSNPTAAGACVTRRRRGDHPRIRPPRWFDRGVTRAAPSTSTATAWLPSGARAPSVRRGRSLVPRPTGLPSYAAAAPMRESSSTPRCSSSIGTGDARGRCPSTSASAQGVVAARGHRRCTTEIVRDDSYTDAMGAGRTLVLIGTPRDHRLLARSRGDRLPVAPRRRTRSPSALVSVSRAATRALRLRGARPRPTPRARCWSSPARSPTRGAALALAARPAARPTWCSTKRVAPAPGGACCSAPQASVRAAGYFDDRGAPVGPTADPVPVNPASAPATASDDADEGN